MDATPPRASSVPSQPAASASCGDPPSVATFEPTPSSGVGAGAVGSSPAPIEPDDWAICCSGRGIGAASYCLGALQILDEGGLLARTKWILGVSGGSYITASRALVAHDLGPTGHAPPAYASGSPEEQHFLRNAGHIAGGANALLVGGISLLGALVVVTVILAPLYAFSHAWGWLLHEQGVLTRPAAGLGMSASVTAFSWWIVPVVAAAITAALFVSWWSMLQAGESGRWFGRASLTGWVTGWTAVLAVMMLVVPLLISLLSDSTGAAGSIVRFFAFIKSQYLSRAALPGLIAVAAAVARSIKQELDKANQPDNLKSPDATATTGRKLASWALTRLLPWLASAALIALGTAAALLWIAAGAAAGFTLAQLWPVIAALVVMLLGRVALDVTHSSLQKLSRWRLADTYAVTRPAALAGTPEESEPLFAKAARTRLSGLSNDRRSEGLVIVTTANIEANREVTVGRGGYSLVFDPDHVTLRADLRSVEPNVVARTTDYEHLLGPTQFTLFDLLAISGAPLSPRLRRMANRGAYRILLTLTNMRPGVWMPHPAVVRGARYYLDTPSKPRVPDTWWAERPWLLLLWYMSQHPFWQGGPWHRYPGKRQKRGAILHHWEQREQLQRQRRQRQMARWLHREDQLWAHVLGLQVRSTEYDGRLRTLLRLRAAAWRRVMRPTLGMLWADATGRTSYRNTWIKVSDGDYHDSLGLVEALRRGASNIVVLDASGDHPGSWLTVGRAISLARSAGGVDINLEPATTPDSNGEPGRGTAPRNEQVPPPWAYGTFTRPWLYDDRLPKNGHIWVCKLGWKDNSDQSDETASSHLYDSADVEPYQRLGASAIAAAVRAGRLPIGLANRPTVDEPLPVFNFRVSWGARQIASVGSISTLRLDAGADKKMRPGPVELTRARSGDDAFEVWAADPTPQTVTIAVLNAYGVPSLSLLLEGAVPVSYVSLDTLDADSAQTARERLILRCQAIRRVPVTVIDDRPL